MKLHKAQSTEEILLMFSNMALPCQRLATSYIIEPAWNEDGITYDIEKICEYHCKRFSLNYFVIDGKLFSCENNPKAIHHFWHIAKSAAEVYQIGLWAETPYENKKKTISLISGILHEGDRDKLSHLLFFQSNFRLAISAKENLHYLKVTEGLYSSGLKACVNEWQEENEEGLAKATNLEVGDYLIISKHGVYCVDSATFHIGYSPISED